MSSIRTILYLALFISIVQLNHIPHLLQGHTLIQFDSPATTQLLSSQSHNSHQPPQSQKHGYYIELEETEEERIGNQKRRTSVPGSDYRFNHYNLRNVKNIVSRHIQQCVYEYLICWRSRTIDTVVFLT